MVTESDLESEAFHQMWRSRTSMLPDNGESESESGRGLGEGLC